MVVDQNLYGGSHEPSTGITVVVHAPSTTIKTLVSIENSKITSINNSTMHFIIDLVIYLSLASRSQRLQPTPLNILPDETSEVVTCQCDYNIQLHLGTYFFLWISTTARSIPRNSRKPQKSRKWRKISQKSPNIYPNIKKTLLNYVWEKSHVKKQ